MLRKVEKSAKSLNEALADAAEELGVKAEELDYEVIRETGKGLLGRLLTGKEVVVSAWIKAEADKEKSKAVKEKPAAKKPEIKSEKTLDKKTEKVRESAKNTKDAKSAEKESKPAENSGEEAPAPKSSGRKIATVVPADAVAQARDFVAELLRLMGFENIKLNVRIGNNGSTIDIDVSGDKMGLLIGKRGETINSVQYLTGLYVNHGRSEYIKVNIDTENYRRKREETLVRLAHSLERRAIRENQSITLEPMNANERRIIHSALQNNPNITTYSVGNEPNRKVVVAPKK